MVIESQYGWQEGEEMSCLFLLEATAQNFTSLVNSNVSQVHNTKIH